MLKRLRQFNVLSTLLLALRNRLRRRYQHLDYLILTLPASMPALPESRGWIRQRLQGAPPLSLWDLDRIFRRIAADPRPQGVILKINGLALPLADLQTLRTSILRLRAQGKRVVCFAQNYSLSQYYVASAADEILLQPDGELLTLGLNQEAVFLKDALSMVGVSLDVVAITPYKSAYDQFSRETPSPEGRAQVDWLLDSRYAMIVNGIAEGRHCTPDEARALIDTSPHVDDDAFASHYVDALLNEEGFAAHLKTEHLVLWKDADKKLLVQPKPRGEKSVALLRINGLMTAGESADPPINIPIPFIGGSRAGDQTVVRQVRSLLNNKSVAAVVLYINSGGGAAIAAEAMTSALEQLAGKCPLVVYMNTVAGSGGYYVATPAHWIVAQPATLTGSIGVLSGKFITADLRQKLGVNTVHFRRGANAGILGDTEPFTDTQRAQMRHTIEIIYAHFVAHVVQGRHMSAEAVDAVGGGRVWTGEQALQNGLVDQLGDLHAAIAKARQLAKLPDNTPLLMVAGKGKPLPPQIVTDPAAALSYALDNAHLLLNGSAQVIVPIWWKSSDGS